MSVASFSYGDMDVLEVYTGERVNIKNYVIEQYPEFSFSGEISIQNLNASVLEIDDYYNLLPKIMGNGLVVLSNGRESISLSISVVSPIESIHMDKKYVSLLLGEVYTLDVKIDLKKDAVNVEVPSLIWKSSNPKIASIANGNTVVTKFVGNTILTAFTESGNEVLKLEVTVLGHDNKLRITNENTIRTLNVGEELKLDAHLGTKDVTKTVEWISLTPHVVEIKSSGRIRAIGEGRGKIQAITSTGNKAVYELSTYSMIDRVELNHSKFVFKGVGQTEQLMFNLFPADKRYPPILNGFRYISSNPKVVSVSETGLLRAEGPGIALVSVIFDDSQKRAVCSVEVLSEETFVTSNYIALKDIVLEPYEGTALIGEKIPLYYQLIPENASNKEISFSISQGDTSQIERIGQTYYFIPKKRGLIKVTINGADNSDSQIAIPVTSPIKSLDLYLESRRIIGSNEESIYIGEMPQIITRLYAKSGFSTEHIYPSSLVYTVEDDAIAVIVSDGDKKYLKGLKRGRTEVKVSNLEGLHEASLWVNVEDPIASVFTDDQVRLPMGTYYKPRVSANLIKTAKIGKDGYDLSSIVGLKVKQVYLEEKFIEEELNYEVAKLKTFGQPPYTSEVLEEIRIHENRLNLLQQYKNNVVNQYVLLNDVKALKDRMNRNYKFYTIRGHQIQSNYPVKLNVEMGFEHLPYTTQSMISWKNDYTDVEIFRLNNRYDSEELIEEYGLKNSLKGLNQYDKIRLLIAYINNIELFRTIPDYELLNAFELVSKDSVLFDYIKPIDSELTKSDLLYLSYLLHKKYVDRSLVIDSLDKVYYQDIGNKQLSRLISLGYVAPNSDSYFGLDDQVSSNMLNEVLRKVIPSYVVETGNVTNNLTYRDLILALSHIIQ
jgi:uncharacterized protein YjdB